MEHINQAILEQAKREALYMSNEINRHQEAATALNPELAADVERMKERHVKFMLEGH